ncbi:unnamed protein product [Sphagnum jensenii]
MSEVYQISEQPGSSSSSSLQMAGSLLPVTMCRPSMEQQHQRRCGDLVVKFRSRAARCIEAEKIWRQKKCLFASKCSKSQGKQTALPTRCLPINRLGQ